METSEAGALKTLLEMLQEDISRRSSRTPPPEFEDNPDRGQEGSNTVETSEAGALKTLLEMLQEDMRKLRFLEALMFITLMDDMEKTLKMKHSEPLIQDALKNCQDAATRRWLTENSGSFFQLEDMVVFLKKHLDEEEMKKHSNDIHITFVAHGSIRDPMMPARCLLPLPNITDVVLYSPWNCGTTADVTYGIATGKLRPQHRLFYSKTSKDHQMPNTKHRPTKVPNHWNSMKKAGDNKIPNIWVSPLRPGDGVWKKYQSLTEKYGRPGINRIIIPFNQQSFESVPFSVVTLALSLVLLSSRFKATVHLDVCLSKSSAGTKLDDKYLEQQYACTIDYTGMSVSEDVFRETWSGFFKRLFS